MCTREPIIKALEKIIYFWGICGQFLQFFNLKNLVPTYTKDFFNEKKFEISPSLGRGKFTNGPDFYNGNFQPGSPKYGRMLFLKNLKRLLYVIYSQIWLNLLMGDCHFHYITQIEKENTNHMMAKI
jgi:hypothetical protein